MRLLFTEAAVVVEEEVKTREALREAATFQQESADPPTQLQPMQGAYTESDDAFHMRM